MDIWAMCRECDRWFYCEGSFEETSPPPTCPVCGAAAATVVDRARYPDGPPGAAAQA